MHKILLSTFFVLAIISVLCQATRVVKLYNLANYELPYKQIWNFQQRLQQAQIDTQTEPITSMIGSLLILQHRSVYTLGTGTQENSGPFSFSSKDGTTLEYETLHIERAGQATYHGPGQLVLYPILDLEYFEKDIHNYLRNLEEVVICTCKDFGISANRVDGLTGVWVGEHDKISAIGIKIRRWVTLHGLSLNCFPDMRYFDNIVPCGITDRKVCSMAQYNPDITIDMVAESLLLNFAKLFDVKFDRSLSSEEAFSNVNEVLDA